MANEDVDILLNYICQQSIQSHIYYLWRPIFNVPKDDMVLEIAEASSVDFIVTYNVKDFHPAKTFGIEIAKQEHVSINQFIMLAVAEKVSVLGAEDIIRERAKHGSKKKFLSILKNAPNVEPEREDKL